jgi:hypothetical protein
MGSKNYRKKMHHMEMPVSMQSSVIANSSRDPKRKKDPYKMEDFYLFSSVDDLNIPSANFGSAAMELIKLNKFPSWALFTFKELKQAASGPPPSLLAYIGDDVIILAPSIADGKIKGMVICMESSYNEQRQLTSLDGQRISIVVPSFKGKVYAEEGVSIPLLG